MKKYYNIDVAAVLDRNGVDYSVNGDWFKMLCPFPDHDDKTPSFNIHIDGAFHCWSCGRHGTFVELCKEIGWSDFFDGSAKVLTDVISSSSWKSVTKSIDKYNKSEGGKAKKGRFPFGFKLINSDDKICEEHYSYCIKRFRGNKNIFKSYEIGYTNKYDSEYDGNYRKRIVIPVKDESGALLWCEGRAIREVRKRKYYRPFGVQAGKHLFNADRMHGEKYVVVVEGILDAMYLNMHGINSVCVFGADVNVEQLLLLIEFETVLLSLDNDDAGFKGYVDARDKLLNAGVEVKHVALPKGKDALAIGIKKYNERLKAAKAVRKKIFAGY